MSGFERPIRLSAHARLQAERRGATAAEIERAIREAPWVETARGRRECRLDLDFGDLWNGVHYGTKRVRPIFAEEIDEIVVVTVYVYYF